MKDQELKSSITIFERKIIKYHQNLNMAGIWLFVATLGCWSVDEGIVRIAAVLITFYLFSHQLVSKSPSFKLFKTESKEIKDSIVKSELEEDTKEARLRNIEQVEKKQLGWLRIVKYLPAYYLSLIFIGASMAQWVGFI